MYIGWWGIGWDGMGWELEMDLLNIVLFDFRNLCLRFVVFEISSLAVAGMRTFGKERDWIVGYVMIE